MSKEVVEKDRELELMTDEADDLSIAKEKMQSIHKMCEDRDKKAFGARDRLVAQLEVTSAKYRTANGVMSALDTIRTVYGDACANMEVKELIDFAKDIASCMSREALNMANAALDIDPGDMSILCDGAYDKDFCEMEDCSSETLVKELMRLQLCQNVGPSTEDISDFWSKSYEEIEAARDDLYEFCVEHDVDLTELCSPNSCRPDCDLCARYTRR